MREGNFLSTCSCSVAGCRSSYGTIIRQWLSLALRQRTEISPNVGNRRRLIFDYVSEACRKFRLAFLWNVRAGEVYNEAKFRIVRVGERSCVCSNEEIIFRQLYFIWLFKTGRNNVTFKLYQNKTGTVRVYYNIIRADVEMFFIIDFNGWKNRRKRTLVFYFLLKIRL